MRPCKQSHAPVRERPGGERLVHRRRGLEVGLLRFLDDRIDDVGLTSQLQLSIDELQHTRARRLLSQRRRDRTTARRPLVEHAQVEVTVHRERERARDRRRRHEEYVGRFALRRERLPLLDAESVLLVDRREPETRERRGLLHERVRPDHQHGLVSRQPRGDRLAPLRGEASRQQHRLDAERGEQSAHRDDVLLGEQLRRHHDRGLPPVLDGEHRGEQRDDRLAAPDVALEQPLHSAVAAHVGDDLPDRPRLRARELERERFAQCRRQLPFVLEANAGAMLARELLGPLVQQMNEEQLLEREARPAVHRLGQRRRPVHHAQRVADARNVRRLQHAGRQILGDQRQQCVQVSVDDRSDHLERQPFRGRIDRQHPSLRGGVLVGAEVHVLARLKLSAVKEAHVAAHQQHVALVDRPIEERLPGP